MSNIYKSLLLVSLTLVLWCCGEDSEDDILSANAEYYVKYEADVRSYQISNEIEYTVNTENGAQTFISGSTFSQTFGPFKKGFNASIVADASHMYQADCNVRIYVCRGSEPFTLKANNSGGKKVSTSYTIDY